LASLDSSAIDAAIVAYLRADAPLAVLLPDGVFLDDAPQGSERFVLVRVLEARDEGTYDGRGFELVTYEIAAIGCTRVIDSATLANAAARMDDVLEGAIVPVSGYPAGASVARILRLRAAFEFEDEDRSVRWYRRGGQYEVHAPN
jgi:hypothetical protein